jgi:hypothetical protein
MDQIDQEAAAKKKLVEEQFYDKFYTLIDSVTTDTPVQYQTPAPQVVVQKSVSTQSPVSSQQVNPQETKPKKKGLTFKTKFIIGLALSGISGVAIITLVIRIISGLGSA